MGVVDFHSMSPLINFSLSLFPQVPPSSPSSHAPSLQATGQPPRRHSRQPPPSTSAPTPPCKVPPYRRRSSGPRNSRSATRSTNAVFIVSLVRRRPRPPANRNHHQCKTSITTTATQAPPANPSSAAATNNYSHLLLRQRAIDIRNRTHVLSDSFMQTNSSLLSLLSSLLSPLFFSPLRAHRRHLTAPSPHRSQTVAE
ncbi:unnamed protein product [Camellia sinensis]